VEAVMSGMISELSRLRNQMNNQKLKPIDPRIVRAIDRVANIFGPPIYRLCSRFPNLSRKIGWRPTLDDARENKK
jgi:hypothetical protein